MAWISDVVQRPKPLRQLLIAIGRNEPGERLARLAAEIDVADVVQGAQRHHVVSLMHERLRDADGVPTELINALGHLRLIAQIRVLHLERAISVLTATLEVPWMTVKGRALANWQTDPATREFNDIDIVVRPADFGGAVEQLAVAGIELIGANWHGYHAHEVAEIPLAFDGASIDLHWNLIALGRTRRHIRIPTEALFERADQVPLGGTEVLTLDPVDTLLHLCANVGLDGGRRLRGLLDIHAVAGSDCVDFAAFAARARQYGVARLAAAVLQRSNMLLGTSIPSGLLAELAESRAWLAANQMIERAGSAGWHSSDGIASGLLLGSGRDSHVATVGALGRTVGSIILSKFGRPALTQAGGDLDWQQRPADGDVEAHRTAYLDWVAAEAMRGIAAA